ncbi:MAG: hypothetical protein CMO80_06255 [Verrucomicrobiales bacterium]|nr:hypothetical protein [Verrucomicrobiales bacterium]
MIIRRLLSMPEPLRIIVIVGFLFGPVVCLIPFLPPRDEYGIPLSREEVWRDDYPGIIGILLLGICAFTISFLLMIRARIVRPLIVGLPGCVDILRFFVSTPDDSASSVMEFIAPIFWMS